MALLDMGAEYHCYASDITCSFPVVERDAAKAPDAPAPSFFTPNQRVTYEAVLAAQTAVIAALRPGVSWVDMHRLAERTILSALLSAGVLTRGGEPSEAAALEAMLAADVGALFMPHGLGHLIGLDTHGAPPPRGYRTRLKTRVSDPR